ncbi:AraC family transcriptional regulator [Maridesulfovibrio bastinii]|uniref:AraC family transcriptional regulator n=1 Tax=Maridesulfovibrio bastinii TaxID=47157 RepID=UPI00041E676D|nr:AraC family transcriptional regulator [Maridesulfovibrio bastinii]
MTGKPDEAIKFFNLSGSIKGSALHGTDILNSFPRHSHSCYVFLRVDSGTRSISSNGKKLNCHSGQMLFINPNLTHRTASCPETVNSSHSYRAICIAPEVLRSIAEQISDTHEELPGFELTPIYNESLEKDFNNFFQVLETEGVCLSSDAALNTFLSKALLLACGNPPVPAPSGMQSEALLRTKKYLEENYIEKITLSELSAVACLSPFHLQRLYVENFGTSPQEYLIKFRVEQSIRLLKEGCTPAEAAMQTGFSDQSHFSRHFKKNIGISPGKFIHINFE